MDSLVEYSHYLALQGQNIGLTTFDGHALSPKEAELKAKIRRVCQQVIVKLQTCEAKDIAALTDSYSKLYMIGFRAMPDPSFLEKQRNRLFNSWKSGDKTIEESHLYGMMLNPSAAMPKPQREAFLNMQGRWVNSLNQQDSFADVDSYERYQRLALLMRDHNISNISGNPKSTKKEMVRAEQDCQSLAHKQQDIKELSAVCNKPIPGCAAYIQNDEPGQRRP